MQFTYFLAAFAIGAPALAQDFSKVPACAIGPAMTAFTKTGCGIMDINCLCSKTDLIPELMKELTKSCNPKEINDAAHFAIDTCKNAGKPISI